MSINPKKIAALSIVALVSFLLLMNAEKFTGKISDIMGIIGLCGVAFVGLASLFLSSRTRRLRSPVKKW